MEADLKMICPRTAAAEAGMDVSHDKNGTQASAQVRTRAVLSRPNDERRKNVEVGSAQKRRPISAMNAYKPAEP